MPDISSNVRLLLNSQHTAQASLSGTGAHTAVLIDSAGLVGADGDGSERVMVTSIRWCVEAGENISLTWQDGSSLLTLVGNDSWDNLNIKAPGDAADGDIDLSSSGGSFSIIISVKKYAGYADIPNPRFGPPLS